jgi:histidinol-phosphate aminotransferase
LRIRKIFDGFEPYGWETPSHEIAAAAGLPVEDVVRLDTNTSPYPPLDELARLARAAASLPVNQYPDTTYLDLRRGLAAYCKLGVDRFVVTNGADEGLDIIGKTVLAEGDEAIVPAPTYAMFRVVPELMGARVRYVHRRKEDFTISPEDVLGAVTKETSLIFLCNPNSPTGNTMTLDDIRAIAEGTRATVAVDEAYYEYWGESATGLTDSLDNLVVCRTLSKAFSMAGVRVGYLVAGKETVDKLNLVRPPNSLTVVSLMLAEAALDNLEEMRDTVRKTVEERRRVAAELLKFGFVRPFPSETNFILFRVEGGEGQATRLHEELKKRGFVVRAYSGSSGIGDCLRLTIGTREMNDGFLDALRASSPSGSGS